MTVVNRVPLLHKPLPADASLADIVEYWNKRCPLVDWYQVTQESIDWALRMVGDAIGVDVGTFDLSNRRW
ncbi:hypothetical protein SEA_TOLLS_43 [Gordonia phage Tolls]|nr:hypothetical protein SEA_TOLLS_43 [Gordonia phage Tolls]